MSTFALNGRTLVLNRAWAAISTTPVRNALSLLYKGTARAICPDTFTSHDFASWADLSGSRGAGGEYVATVAIRIRIPEVILLKFYSGYPRKGVAFSRRNLYRRDGFTCQYCGSQPGTELLSIDHVVPRSRGGRSTWENCVLSCLECNKRKANRSLGEAGLGLVRHPYRPQGGPAFEISLGTRRQSWERFVSERYWNIELQP